MAIKQWLHENRNFAFSADATSPCCMHGKPCQVRPQLPTSWAAAGRRPLRMNVAGVTCIAYSTEGAVRWGTGPGTSPELPGIPRGRRVSAEVRGTG